MPRTKKTPITFEQADELEQLLSDCFAGPEGFGDSDSLHGDIRKLLKQTTCPKDAVKGLFTRLNEVSSDMDYLHEEVTRGNVVSLAESFQRLDDYLNKHFTVQMPRKNQTYRWMVGS